MHPVLVRFDTPEFLRGIFPETITLYSYGFMILIGVLFAFWHTWYRRKEFNLDADQISDIFLWCFIGVFVGGKVFFYFEDPGRYLANPALMFKGLGSGFVFYGSFLVTIPVLIWRFKKKNIPVLPMFDVVAISGALVHGFGKLGCFMSGCCHGIECHNPLGITFTHPESNAEPLNIPLYPTQLMDAAMILGIVLLMLYLYPRKKFHGQLILLYALIYGVGRTITEVYRGDEARGYIIDGILTHSQFIAIFILASSAYLWRKWSKSQRVKAESN
ncbi:MAG: prolipoprotein diacylglyceryl transferase [Bacteroidetes bacterium]|nr:MAG: prolipoprotein diacylglyceryl transferase [Bacteroidota bacterium]